MKEIKLTQGKIALVDDEDFDSLNKFKWYYHSDGYAARSSPRPKQTTLFMHREIMKTPKGMLTDHKDRNRTNNQRNNLRICNESQNTGNSKRNTSTAATSRFIGVCVQTSNNKYKYYKASLHKKDKIIAKLFLFTTAGEIAAAKHYNELAKQHYGEYAILNPV